MRIAIIGAGISGMATAHLLNARGYNTVLFERDKEPGGLIRCKRVEGSLYHICGGHVFNSKRQDVLSWFWNFFERDKQFSKAKRNSVVFMDNGLQIPYPIENHAYMFDTEIQKSIIKDLLDINEVSKSGTLPDNFEDFLLGRFGRTLYEAYFRPYNEKVWRRDLKRVPLSWLEGKLPMPSVEEIIFNNMNHVEENLFVHSSFWYEKQGGSQFIVDTLSNDLDIRYEFCGKLTYNHKGNKWKVGHEEFDKLIFCGNIKTLLPMLEGIDLNKYAEHIDLLESHGTTSVFCEIDNNPYSWIYMPSDKHSSHRIICTGNFAKSNNAEGKMTGTIEFTDAISKSDILDNLARIPLHPKYIDHHYNQYTYPIQNSDTRSMIGSLKEDMAKSNLYMTGRFADWEYYNMDAAIGASMDMCERYGF